MTFRRSYYLALPCTTNQIKNLTCGETFSFQMFLHSSQDSIEIILLLKKLYTVAKILLLFVIRYQTQWLLAFGLILPRLNTREFWSSLKTLEKLSVPTIRMNKVSIGFKKSTSILIAPTPSCLIDSLYHGLEEGHNQYFMRDLDT